MFTLRIMRKSSCIKPLCVCELAQVWSSQNRCHWMVQQWTNNYDNKVNLYTNVTPCWHKQTYLGPSGYLCTLTSVVFHFSNLTGLLLRTRRPKAMHTACTQTHTCSWHVVEASKCCRTRYERGRKATQRESMRVQGSCRFVAVCPMCILLRAGTDTMKPAVLAGVALACLLKERHTEEGHTWCTRVKQWSADYFVTNVALQCPSATGPLSYSHQA